MPVDLRSEPPNPPLSRSLGLTQAISLNVANMVGIGPFITIPFFLTAMGGPQAVFAWIAAAVLVLCDGLVWSELGAALPGSGGSYHFLKEIYGPLSPTWGRLIPFLFIWQFLISGTLEAASGYLGAMDYMSYIFTNLDSTLRQWHILGGKSTIAAALSLCVTALLCRRVSTLGWMSVVLCVGTLAALLIVIVSGLTHFDAGLLRIPEMETEPRHAGRMIGGLGVAMTFAIYDYLGYYNICFLGDEVRDPARNIPRAVIRSIGVIAVLYLAMNVSILGVVPWQEAMHSENIAADFMERLYGRGVAIAFTWLVVWTAVGGVFAMSLGYSRIPFAAARKGDFFAVFARLAPRGQYPYVSILTLGTLAAACCYVRLQSVINAAVAVRIIVQFLGQIVGLHLLRTRRPDVPLPFRMRLYPLPSLIAMFGWLFVLGTSDWIVLASALGVTAAGLPAFFAWRRCAPIAAGIAADQMGAAPADD